MPEWLLPIAAALASVSNFLKDLLDTLFPKKTAEQKSEEDTAKANEQFDKEYDEALNRGKKS